MVIPVKTMGDESLVKTLLSISQQPLFGIISWEIHLLIVEDTQYIELKPKSIAGHYFCTGSAEE